jgi:Na+/proline symporter
LSKRTKTILTALVVVFGALFALDLASPNDTTSALLSALSVVLGVAALTLIILRDRATDAEGRRKRLGAGLFLSSIALYWWWSTSNPEDNSESFMWFLPIAFALIVGVRLMRPTLTSR